MDTKPKLPISTGTGGTARAGFLGLEDAKSPVFPPASGSQSMVVWDGAFNIVCWSQGCPEFWYNPVDILRPGMPMIGLLQHIANEGGFGGGDTGALAEREFNRIRAFGPESEDEFHMRDGRIIHVQRRSVDGGGHAAIYTDITERQQAEDALRNTLEGYRQSARMLSVGHWLWDEVNHRVITCSEECARIHGVPLEEFLVSVSNLDGDIAWAHPDDRDRYQKAVDGNASFDIEYRIVRPNGEVRYVHEIGEPETDRNGVVIRSRGTMQDVTNQRLVETALQDSETRYQEIFDEAPATLWVEDWTKVKQWIDRLTEQGVTDWPTYLTDNRDQVIDAYDLAEILQTSNASLQLFGATNEDDYLQYVTGAQVTPGELDAFVEVLLLILDGQWEFEVDSMDTRMDDTMILVHTRGIVPPAYRHDWSKLIYSMEDVTDKRAVAVALKQAKEEAEKANRVKSQFLAHMSHELRTPLNAITGFTQLIADESFGQHSHPKYREYANDVLDSGHLLLAVINDILDLSKIEAGEIALDPVRFSLHPVLQDCVKLITIQNADRSTFIQALPSENVPHLYADERVFRQIILNLLSNANKFTPDGGHITITSERRDDKMTLVHVVDDGMGISDDDLVTVLEPFGQARSDIRVTHEGTGLGLPLSLELVKLHGGNLHIQSELNVGTTVTVSFPDRD